MMLMDKYIFFVKLYYFSKITKADFAQPAFVLENTKHATY